ncbi:hypothetical protein V9P87_31715, partial [Pseudomonas aeruginosa]
MQSPGRTKNGCVFSRLAPEHLERLPRPVNVRVL